MPKNKVDPLGRNHTTIHKPTNRHQVDRVCDYILEHEEKDFRRGDNEPNIDHVYYNAYAVIYGIQSANKMLNQAHDEWCVEAVPRRKK